MSDLRERFRESEEELSDVQMSEGHQERFLNKLEARSPQKSFSNGSQLWRVAAALIVVIASAALYWISKDGVERMEELAEAEVESNEGEEIPLKEATFYYKQTMDQQFAALEQFYGDNDSKELIEETKELISDLQIQYELLEKELEESGDERIVIAMIENYQKRIELLEKLIKELTYIKQIKLEQDEKSNQNA